MLNNLKLLLNELIEIRNLSIGTEDLVLSNSKTKLNDIICSLESAIEILENIKKGDKENE